MKYLACKLLFDTEFNTFFSAQRTVTMPLDWNISYFQCQAWSFLSWHHCHTGIVKTGFYYVHNKSDIYNFIIAYFPLRSTLNRDLTKKRENKMLLPFFFLTKNLVICYKWRGCVTKQRVHHWEVPVPATIRVRVRAQEPVNRGNTKTKSEFLKF